MDRGLSCRGERTVLPARAQLDAQVQLRELLELFALFQPSQGDGHLDPQNVRRLCTVPHRSRSPGLQSRLQTTRSLAEVEPLSAVDDVGQDLHDVVLIDGDLELKCPLEAQR